MIQSLVSFAHNLPQILADGGYWALAIIVILEGIPLIGSIFLGHIAIISAGFLAKLGILSLPWVLAISIAAAVFGDIVGFMLGRKYGLVFIEKFGKYVMLTEEHIAAAKKLIENHTRKAIIFGKFSPITRPLMPYVVGASGVHIKTFWLYNIIGGACWVVISILVGYIFGASYDIAAQYLGKFLIVALVSTLLILWSYRFVNIRFHIFRKYELFVLGLNLLALWALAKSIQDVLATNSFMVNFDVWVNSFMVEHVTPAIATIATIITNVGGTVVTGAAGLLVGIYFIYKKGWRRAAIMILSVGSTVVVIKFMKELFLRTRPDDALKLLADPSFPSGHAGMAAAFFVALAYVFAPSFQSWVKREGFIVLCVLATIAIGLSRIVINVHWASDVIGGWALGTFLATGSILLVRYVGVLFIKTDK